MALACLLFLFARRLDPRGTDRVVLAYWLNPAVLLLMLWRVGSMLRDPFISGAAANFWWLITPLVTNVPIVPLRIAGAAMTLAAIGWAVARVRTPDAAVLAAIAAINMNVFYGLGVGVGWAMPRTIAGVDVMIPVAAANVAAFGWHAAVVATPRATRARPLPV